MPSALMLLNMALARLESSMSKAPDAERAMGKIGEGFQAAYATPGALQKGRTFASTPAGLAQQFDTEAPQLRLPTDAGDVASTEIHIPSDLPSDPSGQFHRYAHDEFLRNFQGDYGVRDHIANGALDPTGQFWHANTMDLGNSTTGGAVRNAGGRFYGVMDGMLSNANRQRPTYNFSDTYTQANVLRRPYGMSDSLARDPKLAGRLLVSPELLDGIYSSPVGMQPGARATRFTSLPATEQIGGLQAVGARQTLQALKDTLDRTGQHLDMSRKMKAAPAAIDNIAGQKSGLETLVGRMFDDDATPMTFERAAQVARGLPGGGLLGPAALRKARLTTDFLDGSAPADTSLYRGLGFAAGGLVQFGSLTGPELTRAPGRQVKR